MCGRVVLVTPPEGLASCFGAVVVATRLGRPRYNVAPGADVFGLVDPRTGPTTPAGRTGGASEETGGAGEGCSGMPGRPIELRSFRWGVRLPGAPVGSAGRLVHNARSETVASRPLFAAAYRHRRIVVPVDGFFEWERRGKERQPHYFTRRDGDPLALAGLWLDAAPTGGGPDSRDVVAEAVPACVIVTTGASSDMGGVHDRMPVVLERDGWEAWLDPCVSPGEPLRAIPGGRPTGVLVHHAVDRRVGSTRADDPGVIEPLDGLPAGIPPPTRPVTGPPTLF